MSSRRSSPPPAPVCAFDSARAALAAIDDRQPALVITDIAMPELDGYALTRMLRERAYGKSDTATIKMPSACATAVTSNGRRPCTGLAPSVSATEIEPGPTVSGMVSG